MKKFIKLLATSLLAVTLLSGCGAKGGDSDKKPADTTGDKGTVKLVIGASPEPHAEILEVVKPILKEKGIEIEVTEFNDYVLPNMALDEKKLDANFFQHKPYMEDFAKEKGMKLVSVANVHIEPMGAYSKKIKSKDELKDGATVSIPNDATNEGRALLLLQKEGLIKLKDEKSLAQTPRDIVENPKNLKFSELEAAQLPRTLQDVDLSIINTNFALKIGLNPMNDAIFMEDKDSPYANVLAVREDNQDSPAILELAKALNSPEVKKFIEDKYKGAIIPAF